MREFRYFLDSNIFLRPIVKDNIQKVKECEDVFQKIKKGEIKAFTSNLILAEIVWTSLRFYKIKREKLLKVLKGISDFKNLKIIDNFNFRLAVEIYKNFPVKFIDALIVSNRAIFQRKAVVVSYDRDFDKIGTKRIEPKEIV